jgi:hypothetical protein
MCFKSSFFPWYFKCLRLVNSERFKSLFFALVFHTFTARKPWSQKIKISLIIIETSFKDV